MASRAPADRGDRAAPAPQPPAPVPPARFSPFTIGGSDLSKVWELERLLGPKYRGWAIDDDGLFAVDTMANMDDPSSVRRFTGWTLAEALDQAIVFARPR